MAEEAGSVAALHGDSQSELSLDSVEELGRRELLHGLRGIMVQAQFEALRFLARGLQN